MGDLRLQWLVTIHGEIVIGSLYWQKEAALAPKPDASALDRIEKLIKEQ